MSVLPDSSPKPLFEVEDLLRPRETPPQWGDARLECTPTPLRIADLLDRIGRLEDAVRLLMAEVEELERHTAP
jgi:hypothetical protein